jgi:hypothetical protein
MVIELQEGYGATGVCIQANASEMESIVRLLNRAVQVRRSHEPESKKKEYFTNDDVETVIRVCGALSSEWRGKCGNTIEDFDVQTLLKPTEDSSSIK